MPEDLNKDRLEDFFKNTLDDESDVPAFDEWDTPGDQVWTKVKAAIEEDKKDRKVIWWWIGGIGLLLIFGVVFWGLNQDSKSKTIEKRAEVKKERNVGGIEKITEDTKAVETVESAELEKEEKNNNRKKLEIKNKALVKKKQNRNEKSSPKNPKLVIENKKSKANPLSKTSIKTQSSQAQKNIILEKSIDSVLNKNNNTENISSNKENLVDPFISNKDSVFLERTDIQLLAALPTKWEIPLLIKDSMILLNKLFPDSKKRISGFYAGLKFGPSNTYRKIKAIGSFNIPDFLREGERASNSLSLGLNLGYQLSKNWSIESGFSYSNISFQTRSRRQIRYTMLNEQLNSSGEFEGNYSLDVETSTGDINTDIAIAREGGTPIAENESISIALTGNQKIHFGSIPIIARYHFGNEKLQIGLKAGLVNRFTLKSTFQYESASVIRSGVRLILRDQFYRVRELENFKNYQMDYLLGASIRYHLSNKLWLYAEPTFTRSMSPIHQSANFETFLSVKSLDFGLNYRF